MGVDLKIAFIRENTPKISPTSPPTTGPSTIAAIITGICIVVAFMIPRGISPSGVMPKTIVMAPRTAAVVNFLLVRVFLFIFAS